MTNQFPPLVPLVLTVATQRHPWQLGACERRTVRYHTETTVFCAGGTEAGGTKPGPGRAGISKHQHKVWCLPDDAAWAQVQSVRTRFQDVLDALADEVRRLGTYAQRLAEAGGVARAPNPLTATTLYVPDPDASYAPSYVFAQRVPVIERRAIASHTPKMLRLPDDTYPPTCSQTDHFVCPDDAAWAQVQALVAVAHAAETAWHTLLDNLGTYAAARADGRYTKQEQSTDHLRVRSDQLNLTQIRADGGTQPRAQIDQATVDAYAEDLANGAVFPPVTVYYDGTEYWLADGFHRLAAHQQRGMPQIAVEIRQGMRRDAVLFSCSANNTHGLRRSPADKERVVLNLLHDPEWQQWSDREIARQCVVSHPFVAKLRARTGNVTSERKTADGRMMDTTGIREANEARAVTAAHGQQAVVEQETAPDSLIGETPILVGRPAPDDRTDDTVPQAPSQAEQAELKRLVRGVAGTWYGLVTRGDDIPKYAVAFHGSKPDDYTAEQIRRRTNAVAEEQARAASEELIQRYEDLAAQPDPNEPPPPLPIIEQRGLAMIGWQCDGARWHNGEAIYDLRGPHPHASGEMWLKKNLAGVQALIGRLASGKGLYEDEEAGAGEPDATPREPGDDAAHPEAFDAETQAKMKQQKIKLLNAHVIDGETRYVVESPGGAILEWTREELHHRLDLFDFTRTPDQLAQTAPSRPSRPAPPPRKPQDAGVSAQRAYLHQLEKHIHDLYHHIAAQDAYIDSIAPPLLPVPALAAARSAAATAGDIEAVEGT